MEAEMDLWRSPRLIVKAGWYQFYVLNSALGMGLQWGRAQESWKHYREISVRR